MYIFASSSSSSNCGFFDLGFWVLRSERGDFGDLDQKGIGVLGRVGEI